MLTRRRFASGTRPAIGIALITAGAVLANCGSPASDRAANAAAQTNASAVAARAKADEHAAAEAREAERLAALWTYYDGPAGAGTQRSATIYSTNDIDTDGTRPSRVRLIFRDHSSWGKSSYLVLAGGDFKCAAGCTVGVNVDDAAPKRMAARRPPTQDAIAMFINDCRGLWRLAAGAKRIAIEFPVKAGGTRTATFEVGGLSQPKMPGWD